MDISKKKDISKLVLKLLLTEILKDGVVEDSEREILEKITNILGIDKELFNSTMGEVKEEIEINRSAGSFNKIVFFKRLSSLLQKTYKKVEIILLLNTIASALHIEGNFIDENMEDIFSEESLPKNREKYNIITKDHINYVEIYLDNDSCRTEAGAMAYTLGNVEMISKGSGGVGGFFKSALSGESFFKPVYKGTGKVVLEPTIYSFYKIELKDEHLILDQGAYIASDESLEISAYSNKAISSLFSGEGWFQTSVKGSGTLIMIATGGVEIIDLKNDTLTIDGNFMVAREATLDFEVTKSTKSLIGSVTSGEGYVNRVSGTGRVYLAMIPNRYLRFGMTH